MVLVLVLHQLESVTATVPMCVLMLNDLLKRKQIPECFRLYEVVPTTGLTSTSLWEVTDLAFFEEWLAVNLGPDVQHIVQHVAEQFSYGVLGRILPKRAGDKAKQQLTTLSSSTKAAVSRAGEQLTGFDQKYEISERTSQTFKKMSTAATQAKDRAMENPTIARVSTNVNAGVQAGLKSVGTGLDWARSYITTTLNPSHPPQASGSAPPAAPNHPQPPTQQTSSHTHSPPTQSTSQAAQRSGGGGAIFDLAGEEED